MARASADQGRGPAPERAAGDLSGHIAAGVRPTDAQRRYLERGLTEPGGKLPLFDRDGREVPRKTIESCMAHGWAEPGLNNPIKASAADLKFLQQLQQIHQELQIEKRH